MLRSVLYIVVCNWSVLNYFRNRGIGLLRQNWLIGEREIRLVAQNWRWREGNMPNKLRLGRQLSNPLLKANVGRRLMFVLKKMTKMQKKTKRYSHVSNTMVVEINGWECPILSKYDINLYAAGVDLTTKSQSVNEIND